MDRCACVCTPALLNVQLIEAHAGSAIGCRPLLTAACAGGQDLGPDLTFVRISGYGQTGPKATLPGYASVCEGYGGLRCALL